LEEDLQYWASNVSLDIGLWTQQPLEILTGSTLEKTEILQGKDFGPGLVGNIFLGNPKKKKKNRSKKLDEKSVGCSSIE